MSTLQMNLGQLYYILTDLQVKILGIWRLFKVGMQDGAVVGQQVIMLMM